MAFLSTVVALSALLACLEAMRSAAVRTGGIRRIVPPRHVDALLQKRAIGSVQVRLKDYGTLLHLLGGPSGARAHVPLAIHLVPPRKRRDELLARIREAALAVKSIADRLAGTFHVERVEVVLERIDRRGLA